MHATTEPAPLRAASPSDNAMTALYRDALGPVNAEYYLPIFARFDERGRAGSHWNWAASLATINWMVLRQLWGAALVYVAAAEGLALLLFGLGRQFLQWPQGVEWGVMAALAIPAFAIPGLYGNAMLHAEMRRRITRALAASQTLPEARALLAQRAATPRRLRMLVAANVALAIAALVALLVLPRATAPALDEAALAPAVTVAQAASAAAARAPASVRSASEARDEIADRAAAGPVGAASGSVLDAAPSAQTAGVTATASAPSATAAPAPADNRPRPSSAPVVGAEGQAQGDAVPPAMPAPAPAPAPAQALAPPVKAPATSRTAAAAPAPAVVPSTPKKAASAARAPVNEGVAPAARTSAPPRNSTAPSTAAAREAGSGAAAASPPAVGTARGYYINVGLFAEEANARKAQARLLNEGFPAFRQELQGAKGRRIRVRAGPYPSRTEAEAAAASIRAMELEAVVFKQ